MTTFPFNTTPLPEFPLTSFPYNSRTSVSNIVNDTKNHGMVAFRPGFPLQASELNEIQDIIFLNNTLTTTMYGLWTTEGETNSIPGWLCSIPLWPQKNSILNADPTENLIYQENTTINGGTVNAVTIVARPGWYYVYVKSSSLRHWIYLPIELRSSEIEITPNDTFVGFKVTYSYVNALTDGTLFDNSATNQIGGSPAGANRVQINIDAASLASTTNINESFNSYYFSPIVKVNSTNVGNVRYLNGRAVPVGI
jgi:hypothetical protein